MAIIGSNGQLGSDLSVQFKESEYLSAIELTHDDIDVSKPKSVERCLNKHCPDVAVNTAAVHDLKKCNDSPTQAFDVNAVGAKNVAEWCSFNNSTSVFISTNYVFDGHAQEPYVEDDCPNPLNTYGISKLAGEHCTASKNDQHIIIRTSGLFGLNPCRGKASHNFVEMFISLIENNDHVEFDGREVFTMTFTENLARQIEVLISSGKTGIFHAVSEGECSLYRFGQEIISLFGSAAQMEFRPRNLKKDITRPDYTSLENRRLDELGMNRMKHWKENLRTYLKKR